MILIEPRPEDRRPDAGLAEPRRAGERRSVVEARSVVHLYAHHDERIVALDRLELTVDRGEFVTVTGASGSGKSTLLRLLAGQEVPTAGTITVDGHRLDALDVAARERFRREVVGIVQQQTADNLFPYLTAVENVVFPMTLGGGRRDRRAVAMELLDLVGVAGRADHRPAQMSGGEQQRVAIAVALANRPALVLADEPTGELDESSTADVVDAFERARHELGISVVAVTHDALVSDRTVRTIEIRNGRVESEIHRRPGDAASARRLVAVDERGSLQLDADDAVRLGGQRLVGLDVRAGGNDDAPWVVVEPEST